VAVATGAGPGDVTITSAGVDPVSAAFNSAGNLWVADNAYDKPLVYTADQLNANSGDAPAAIIETAVIGADGSGALIEPLGLAFDSSGNLSVSNFSGNTIIKYSAAQLATALTVGASSTPIPR
jgi:hypothetical protein